MILLMSIGFVGWFIAATLLRGWALTILWQWFVVSTFHLAPLSIAQALGVSLVVGFLTHQVSNQPNGKFSEQMVATIIFPLLSLGVGYIVKGYL